MPATAAVVVKREVDEHAPATAAVVVKREVGEHTPATRRGRRGPTVKLRYLHNIATASGHRVVRKGVTGVQYALLRAFLKEAIVRAALNATNRSVKTISLDDVLAGQADAARYSAHTSSLVYG